jgi:hypothetical protein
MSESRERGSPPGGAGGLAPALALAVGLGLGLGGAALPPGPARAQAPGPESFARTPETPPELWDAADYLVRTGQARQAVPYLKQFLKANPTDEQLLEIRDRYGVGSVLRLDDDAATRDLAAPLLARFNAAAQRQARDPGRLRRFVAALSGTAEEQQYAVEQLRRAGAHAVPPIVDALSRPEVAPADRARIVQNLARLGDPVLPSLVAVLDSEDETLAADAADALGRLGDRRAIPFLSYHAGRPGETVVREPARAAIARLSGVPYAAQPRTAADRLADEARRYVAHAVPFGGPRVELWTWQDGRPTPRVVTTDEAERYLGARFARQALELEPAHPEAQVSLAALALRPVAGADGSANADPNATALAAGPGVLAEVLRLAQAKGLPELAAPAAAALGRVADRDALQAGPGTHPLVAALDGADRRAKLAAARALVDLDPVRPFPGSSRVVPVLATFASARQKPRAVVIDGEAAGVNNVASVLRELGYDTLTAPDGPAGFRLAAASADVEVILVNPTFLEGPWRTRDLLANLRADAATASVPVLLYGPLGVGRGRVTTGVGPRNEPIEISAMLQGRTRVGDLTNLAPGVAAVVTPSDPGAFGPVLRRELERLGARPLSDAERRAMASEATELLARVATRPNSPLAAGLAAVEPELSRALIESPSGGAAATALAEVPDADAQRGLADVVLDSSRPAALRADAARALARSLQRFGPLLAGEQEARLAQALDGGEADPTVRDAIAAVVGALRPRPEAIGPRLRRAIDPAGALPPPETPPAPGPAPAPATPPAPAAGPPPSS